MNNKNKKYLDEIDPKYFDINKSNLNGVEIKAIGPDYARKWLINNGKNKKDVARLNDRDAIRLYDTLNNHYKNGDKFNSIVSPVLLSLAAGPIGSKVIGGVINKGSKLIKNTNNAIKSTKVGNFAHKIITNPITETVETIHGLSQGYDNIKEGINDINHGDYVKGGAKIGLTALETIGAGDLIRRLGRISNSKYRAKHAFNSITPFGYTDFRKRLKDYSNSLWYNPKIDFDNPKWLEDSYNFLDIDDDIKFSKKRIENREDAWRIYLGLPQKYNTYSRRVDGTYYYNPERIFIKFNSPDHIKKTFYNKDFNIDNIGYNGGYVTKTVDEKKGRTTIQDVWDLHPLRRDRTNPITLINKIENETNNKIRNLAQKTRTSLFYDKDGRRKTKNYTKLDSYLNKLRMDFNLNNYKGYSFIKPKISKTVTSILDKVGKYEIGPLVGGKPFQMRTVLDNDFRIEKLFKEPGYKEFYHIINNK